MWPGQWRTASLWLPSLDLVALGEPAVREDVAHARHAEPCGLRLEAFEDELVARIGAFDRDGRARFGRERFLELGGAARVVDVAVGQKDALGADAELR